MSGDLSGELRELILDVGGAGVARMAAEPGLAAAVDQHVAAVRDRIDATGQTLLEYLHEFTETAFARGWWPNGTGDWEFVRVVAVCWMMRQASGA